MKDFKSLAVFAASTLFLFACSEGSYVPATTTQGVSATATPYLNTAGTNPYLTNNTAYYNGLNGQAQTGLQNYANQNLQSCAARSTPNFYAFTSQNSNVAVRWQPTVTPTQCYCYQAPCNCQQVLTQIRTQCGVETSSSGSSQTINLVDQGSGGSYASDSHGNPQGGGANNGSTIDCGPNSGSSSGSSGINQDSKILPLTITGADAKALYDRLAKAEEKVTNKTHTKVRIGMSYKCMMDGNGKDDKDYACDIDVSVADGLVYEQFPVSASAPAIIAGAVPYSGTNVTAGGTGLNPDEAVI